ncbi:hypothetical protein GCM10010116_03160 [Microbispora rosea subsp. aerata]|nr:CBS domain-containing protein [Microbispora rosea]GGO01707.1 hypothetical protein GCM10010116_03160 [Microbispora rosea subsp. aerata]GIH58312.1 hypothetical protein Mro02_52260 [Microbispora rosea subsp. aerata]GLJ87176.1 hypothetical protein GCM10017588_59200 [Microbispora rosea subsp. aerata]
MPMTVRDVMNRFVVAVEATASFTDVVTAMCRFNVGAVPVVDAERRVIGMVSDEDLLLKNLDRRIGDTIVEGPYRGRERRKAAGRTVSQIMSSPAITVTEDTPLRRAAWAMHHNRIKELPVVDGQTGRITGMVKQSDLVRAFCRPGEDLRDDVLEVVGRHRADCAVRVEDGIVHLEGRVALRSRLHALIEEVWRVDGVVDVETAMTYETDDVGRAVPAGAPRRTGPAEGGKAR